MHNIKILLTTHSTAFATSGGGELALVQLAHMLKRVGLEVDIYGPGSRPLKFYDGIIHYSIESSSQYIIQAAKKLNKKIFLFPNVWWSERPSNCEIDRITKMINEVDVLIFKSKSEFDNFTQYINISSLKSAFLPLPVANEFKEFPDEDLALIICDSRAYVLCIGLLEPIKNQLELIRSLNDLKMNGVFVGGVRDEDYAMQCKMEAHSGIKFLPYIQPGGALLRSLIFNALIYVEPSLDPPGISALEAAILKRPIVISEGPWQREYFGENVWIIKNFHHDEISRAIIEALNDPEKKAKINFAYKNTITNNAEGVVVGHLVNILLANLC